MKTLAYFAGCLSILVWQCNAVFAQGDPVGQPPGVNLTPVNTTPQAQGPTFLQFIQQQQQIQNQIQNLTFPAYLQANPTISPLDQRSGLTSNSVKTINLFPNSLGITTIKVPNIINSNLLSPSNTVVTNIDLPTGDLKTSPVNTITITPLSTTTVNAPAPRPDFSGLSTLLNNLAKTTNTAPTQTNITTGSTIQTTVTNGISTATTNNKPLDTQLKMMEGIIDQTRTDLKEMIGKSNDVVGDLLKTMQVTGSNVSTTATGDKQTSTGTNTNSTSKAMKAVADTLAALSSNTTANPTEKDFLSKLTEDYLNFPVQGTPQERLKVLQEMVKTLTSAQNLGLLPKSAKDDLAKLVAIANDPNNPALKSNDTTTIKFYLTSVLSKTAEATENMNMTLLTTTTINTLGDSSNGSDIGLALSAITKIVQSSGDKTIPGEKTSITRTDKLDKLNSQMNALQTQVAKIDTARTSSPERAWNAIKTSLTEFIPSVIAPGAARVSAASPVKTTISPNATVKSNSSGNAPPVVPTVNMSALQTTLNTQTNTLGEVNTKLDTKMNTLLGVNNAIKNFNPTATNKQQLDMYKSQQQKLQTEINTLKSDKAMAENKMLTTFSQMYGAAAASNLSKAMTNTNMNAKALEAAANSFKP